MEGGRPSIDSASVRPSLDVPSQVHGSASLEVQGRASWEPESSSRPSREVGQSSSWLRCDLTAEQ